jgi:hypothetical protein
VATLKTRAGMRLTRRRVQDLAAEAERGYDLSRARRERVRGGRPSLGEGVSPQISYRVGGALYAKARAKARAQGCTVSQFARQALEEYINR